MIISATKFKLKKWYLYPAFFIDTYKTVKQLKNTKGIIRVKIQPFTLRTLTVWKSVEHMKQFRNSGAHLQAMKKSQYFGSIKSNTWEATEIPTWQEAVDRLDNN